MRQAIEEEKFILDVLASYTTYDMYYRWPTQHRPMTRTFGRARESATLARFVPVQPTNVAQKAPRSLGQRPRCG